MKSKKRMCKQTVSNKSIGVFDSGLGGLTVYQHIKKLLPNENIIYFADTSRAPYGGRPKYELLTFAKEITNFLLTQNVKAIVIGCNTISANCYTDLLTIYDIPMFELINSAITESIKASKSNRNQGIGYLATEASVNSGTFAKGVAKLSSLNVYARGCPLFVPLVEEGLTDPQYSLPAVQLYLSEMLTHIDSLVLGCTHYPFLEKAIKQVTDEYKISIINPAYDAATKLSKFLLENNILAKNEKSVDVFYTTGDKTKFENLVKKLIGIDITTCSIKV